MSSCAGLHRGAGPAWMWSSAPRMVHPLCRLVRGEHHWPYLLYRLSND